MSGAALTLVAGALALAGGAAPAAAAAPGGPYHFEPLGPVRIMDTRGTAKITRGSTREVPAHAYLNVTVTDAPASGVVLTFMPCNSGAPLRSILMSNASPSLFFTGEATCVYPDADTNLILDRVATSGTVTDNGLRYVQIPDLPELIDDDAADQPLAAGAHPIDLGDWVPDDARGIAVEIWAVTEKHPIPVSVGPCADAPYPPQLYTGTVGYGDINVAHAPYTPGTPTCVHVGGVPAYISVALFGYFTDTLAEGGAEPPSYESASLQRPGLVPREPSRVLDTRQGLGAPAGKVAAGGTLELDLSSVVTADTSAVTLNVTATAADANGYVTVFPCADGLPDSSNVNYRHGADVANLVIVEPDLDGKVCLFTSAAAHLLADLGGTYEWEAGLGYRSEGPRRLLDTRSGAGAPAGQVAPNSVTRLEIRNAGGEIPAAVTVNLTAVDASSYGYVTAYPCDQTRPEVSNLNYVGDQTVATLSTVKLSAAGELCLYSFGRTHLLADLAGSYTTSATSRLWLGYAERWFDSREDAISDADAVWEFGVGPLLSDSTAVIANLTATGADEAGFLTGFACTPQLPDASNLNYVPGTDVANLAFIPLGPGEMSERTFCLYNSGTTHELVDVLGWFTPAPAWTTLIRGIDI